MNMIKKSGIAALLLPVAAVGVIGSSATADGNETGTGRSPFLQVEEAIMLVWMECKAGPPIEKTGTSLEKTRLNVTTRSGIVAAMFHRHSGRTIHENSSRALPDAFRIR